MDKTEERPVTFYIFKSLSESLPSIYISKKSISLSSKNIHSTLIKSKKKSHWNHPTRLNAFPSMDPQIASEFCIRDLAPVCKCAINHGSICSSAKGHTAWVTMKLLIPRRPFFLSYLLPISLSLSLSLPDIRNGAEVNISCARRFRRWENGKGKATGREARGKKGGGERVAGRVKLWGPFRSEQPDYPRRDLAAESVLSHSIKPSPFPTTHPPTGVSFCGQWRKGGGGGHGEGGRHEVIARDPPLLGHAICHERWISP